MEMGGGVMERGEGEMEQGGVQMEQGGREEEQGGVEMEQGGVEMEQGGGEEEPIWKKNQIKVGGCEWKVGSGSFFTPRQTPVAESEGHGPGDERLSWSR